MNCYNIIWALRYLKPPTDRLCVQLFVQANNKETCKLPSAGPLWIHWWPMDPIGKTPVRIIIWCPTTKMLIQPLEQEGGCQKCCISLCSKVFINHFYQMEPSPGCLNILIYWSKYLVDRLRRTIRRKVWTKTFYQQVYRLCHYILHQVAFIDCSMKH